MGGGASVGAGGVGGDGAGCGGGVTPVDGAGVGVVGAGVGDRGGDVDGRSLWDGSCGLTGDGDGGVDVGDGEFGLCRGGAAVVV